MTSFALKYLALAAMLLDHVAAVLYRCGWMGWTLKTALRCIGRLAFPIIAWQTAQSWRHTSDKYRYLQRLLLGAAVSAVPYSLTFGTLEMERSLRFPFPAGSLPGRWRARQRPSMARGWRVMQKSAPAQFA